MPHRCFQGATLALAITAGLFLGQEVACLVVPARLDSVRPGRPSPSVDLPHRERDFGTVPQGTVLQSGFPVTNLGTRRLVLVEQSRACCGRSPDQPQITLQPGETAKLRVQVDTSRYCGRIREVVRYNTNDPEMPQFALCVTADVRPSAKPAEQSDPHSDEPTSAPR
jgi:hypothetical protein